MGIGSLLGKVLPRSLPSESGKIKWKLPDTRPAGKAPHYDWITLADNFLWQYFNNPERRKGRPRGIFHPSAGLHRDCGSCRRSMAFELIYAPMSPTKIPPVLAKVLDNGTDRHEGLHKLFEAMADQGYMGIVKAQRELRLIHPLLPIAGNSDMVLTMRDAHRYLFDYKTTSSSNAAKILEPMFKHRCQVTTYMGIAQIVTGYIFYENKDNQKWLGPMERMRINFDPQLYAQIEQFCTDILYTVGQERIPEFDKKECDNSITFCWYRDTCDKHRAGKMSWQEMDNRPETVKRRHLEVFQQ